MTKSHKFEVYVNTSYPSGNLAWPKPVGLSALLAHIEYVQKTLFFCLAVNSV